MIGKKGLIEEIDEDGDAKVSFGEYTWTMSPECLSPCDGKPDLITYEETNELTAPQGMRNTKKLSYVDYNSGYYRVY